MENKTLSHTQAMDWWNNLPNIVKLNYCAQLFPGRTWVYLTGREIETIYNKKKPLYGK